LVPEMVKRASEANIINTMATATGLICPSFASTSSTTFLTTFAFVFAAFLVFLLSFLLVFLFTLFLAGVFLGSESSSFVSALFLLFFTLAAFFTLLFFLGAIFSGLLSAF